MRFSRGATSFVVAAWNGRDGVREFDGADRFDDTRGQSRGGDQPTGAAVAAISRQGQAGRSLLPERRAVARGYVRSQTGLEKYAGKPLPTGHLQTERKTGAAFPSPFKFKKYGRSGIEVSELFPRIAESIDDLCVIRSMKAELPNHEPSLMLMNCGDAVQSRPSIGSWVTYGLGTDNQNLPGFIAMCPGGYPIKGSGELAVRLSARGVPRHLHRFAAHSDREVDEYIRSNYIALKEQRHQLDLLHKLNEEHRQRRKQDARLEARIQSFELAYRMQMEAAERVRHHQRTAIHPPDVR